MSTTFFINVRIPEGVWRAERAVFRWALQARAFAEAGAACAGRRERACTALEKRGAVSFRVQTSAEIGRGGRRTKLPRVKLFFSSKFLEFWNYCKNSNFLERFFIPKFQNSKFSDLEFVPNSAISFFFIRR